MSRLGEVIETLKEFIDGFEVRKQQFDMMEKTYDAMKNGKKVAIHAPTGTGKSFGYLLPYVAVKLDNPSFRITINTNTIALQSQLNKDIEVANSVYLAMLVKMKKPKLPLQTVTLKGNSNYFCEHRFHEAKEDQLPFHIVEELEDYIKTAGIRDKQTMNMDISDTNWNRIAVEGCLKRGCPFKERCTYFNHYSKIDHFDIVIANHALFFYRFLYSDQFWEGFNFHVFDESHKLERGLLDASTYSLTMRQIDGWLFQGAKFAQRLHASEEAVEQWKERFMAHATYKESKELFERLAVWFSPPNKASNLDKMNIEKQTIQKWVKDLQEWQKELHADMVDDVLGFIVNKEEHEDFQKGRSAWLMNLLSLREFGSLSNSPEEIGVLWVELVGKFAQLKVTPESIDYIPSPFVKGCLFTSGTIAQEGSCKAIARRLNVKIDTDLVLTTPFPLHEQTLVHFTEQIQPKMKNWKEALREEIYRMIVAGKKQTFVLFTANKVMNEIYEELLPRLYSLPTDKPLQIWKQEDGNYQDVVASFKNKDVHSILFGSMTYFEGIDLKGDSLTQVILTRLPFSVPTHPIQEILDKKPGYSQWEALVRYEQAFGRLIRTSNDYGVFHVLDSRVTYMKQFKHLFETEQIPTTTQADDVYAFYQNRN